MGLLDFIEQHNLIRAPSDLLGELSGILIANIARRRPDEAANRVTLTVFRHVDAQHGGIVIKHELGECASHFGLPHPSRTEEEERPNGTARVTNAGTCAPDRIRDGRDRLVLVNHTVVKSVFHIQQPLCFFLKHPCDRDTGDARDHVGNILLANDVVELAFREPSLSPALQLRSELQDI